MKKHGFTLAEILITLGIIGVVAALTAPALVQNAGQAKIGPSLAKFVNTFEVATETMMHAEAIDKLSSASNNYLTELSKHMVMTPIGEAFTYTSASGNTTEKINCRIAKDRTDTTGTISNECWQLKDGSRMYTKSTDYNKYTAKGAYQGGIKTIYLDISGNNSGKHRLAKEVFVFALDNSGKLVPVGSNAHKYLLSSFKATCDSSDTFDNNAACTGAIADNNWKADY